MVDGAFRKIVMVGAFLFVWALIANIFASIEPEGINLDAGADEVTIPASQCEASERYVTLERSLGIWGTNLIARVRLSNGRAELVRGYADGSTGAAFSVGGQTLGFGISNIEIWHDPEIETKSMPEGRTKRVHKVYVTFSRTVLLMASQHQTLLLGRVLCIPEGRPKDGKEVPLQR